MSASKIHPLLQRAAMRGTAIDLTIKRSDAGGVSNSLSGVVVLNVNACDAQLRLPDGSTESIPLDEIVSLGVKKRVERSRLGYLIDLLSLTR